ncbi:hypothetical protein [Amycolatopsis sp. WAC 01375]|uniref:hypothetical protein n=1 Tax=Amycolatopsis sp. WAC 01375 TaxID=2203194 RepID=UPI0013154AA0|nr:hypothetical protein [Amycolatopsis sp. WAC 01375]
MHDLFRLTASRGGEQVGGHGALVGHGTMLALKVANDIAFWNAVNSSMEKSGGGRDSL